MYLLPSVCCAGHRAAFQSPSRQLAPSQLLAAGCSASCSELLAWQRALCSGSVHAVVAAAHGLPSQSAAVHCGCVSCRREIISYSAIYVEDFLFLLLNFNHFKILVFFVLKVMITDASSAAWWALRCAMFLWGSQTWLSLISANTAAFFLYTTESEAVTGMVTFRTGQGNSQLCITDVTGCGKCWPFYLLLVTSISKLCEEMCTIFRW